MKNLLNVRFEVAIDDPEEILTVEIDNRNIRLKAVLFIVSELINFNLKNFGSVTVDRFKQTFRNLRWNNMSRIKKHFSIFVLFC